MFLQITTDTIPFTFVRDTNVVLFQIAGNKLPAAVDALDVDDTIRDILRRCWRGDDERPSMSECSRTLLMRFRPAQI